MKIVECFIACCFCSSILTAQTGQIKATFGNVSEEELKMKYYTPDSTAEAVVLFEQGDVSFEYDAYDGLKTVFNYHSRIKILKKSGMYRGIIKLPFYKGLSDEQETISKLEGWTYNLENGTIVKSKLSKEAIFEERVMDSHYQEKISLPNLKEGSVFEYRYKRETPFTVRPTPRTWYFQTDIPMQWSELNLHIPVNLNYLVLKRGYIPFHTNTNATSRMLLGSIETAGVDYHLAVKDAPAFLDEPFILSPEDCISKIEYELTSFLAPDGSVRNYTDTWENLNKTLLEHGNYTEAFKHSAYLKPIVQVLKLEKDTMQQIKKAFSYVTRSVTWDHKASVYAHTDSKKVIEAKTGNCAEINLILVSLLKLLGYDADPVILSTRGNGLITENYPSLDQFNYTIACVTLKGTDLLLDATDSLTKFGMLPEHCLNKTGRLINEKKSRFVSLKPVQKQIRMEFLNASINAKTSEITGNMIVSCGGYEAYDLRKELKAKGEEGMLKKIKKAVPEWELENFKIENKDSVSESLKLLFDFHYTEDTATNIIYMDPMLAGKIDSNPFTQQKRLYPVDLTAASDRTFVGKITLPEGYVLEESPKPVSIALPDNMGRFIYATELLDGAIRISSRITINEYQFAPEEYELLKNFYDRIIQKHAELLVLKKITDKK